MEIKALRETADRLFGKRSTYMTLLQDIAENFYPERADFTLKHDVGDEFGEDLMSSYPIIARRDLGNQIGTMLRPLQKDWFHLSTEDENLANNEAKRWLEDATKTQQRAMYHRKSQFTRATKEGDHDFAAFGQCVISVRLNRDANALLYRCWHIRDVAWQENEEGQVGFVARKWKPTIRDLDRLFPGKNHPDIEAKKDKAPFEEINCYHIVVEADMYSGDAKGKPYWSIYYDIAHDHLIEAVPVYNKEYVIPRWQTVSGSQYAYSPATIVALPDARLIQSMTYTLLEAGEKAVNPPTIATVDAVRSDVSIYAGGITWVDNEYDERLGDALRPLNQNISGIPLGIDMHRDSKIMIHEAFFLNKLTLPQAGPEMTAYETGQRIQEFIRGAIPIFEPMEPEYNGELCDVTFDIMMRAGAFGSPLDMPAALQGAEVQFKFESPLHDAIEQQKGAKLLEAKTLLAEAAAIDQSAINIFNPKDALRDALDGIGTPAKWVRSEVEVEAMERQDVQKEEAMNLLDNMEQGSNIAANMTQAGVDVGEA